MPCGLYYNIRETVWVAMCYDHNVLIEEYDFYNQLPSRMQTNLISLIFDEMIEKFQGHFNFCETGFRNEFVINMLCRKF
jgi:hypothetical protein